MKKNTILSILFLVAIWALGASSTLAQRVIYPNEGYVNDVIQGDTTAAGVRKDSVFIFVRGAEYYFNSTLHNTGYSLTMKAQDGTGNKPKLRAVLDASGTLNIMLQAGNNVYISNLYIDGMGNNPETGEFDATDLMPGALLQASTSGVDFFVDSSIVVNAGQVLLKTSSGAKTVKATNSVFGNTGQLSSDNIGNGRFIDVRNHATDTIIVKNCTILNGYENVFRHYDAGKGNSAQIQYIEFDHNTVYNFAGSNGLFQLGNIVKGFKFTNNLLVDNLSLGWDTASFATNIRFQNYTILGDTLSNGCPVMHLIDHVVYSNQSPTFQVANNVVSYDTAVTNFWKKYGILQPPALDNTIAASVSGTTFTNVDPIAFKKVPSIMTNILYNYHDTTILNYGYGYTASTSVIDMDRQTADFWLNSFDASYTTTNAAFKGTDGLPVGSNNWNSKVVTGINDKPSATPAGFALANNYPNPFNPSTIISFNLPVKSNVTLKIFNVLGQQVFSTSEKDYPAGTHSLNFNAKGLGSGVYIYSIKAAGIDGKNFTATKKMTLLK